MLAGGDEFYAKPYKHYKHTKFTKHSDLLKNSLRQIRDCSLKVEDKAKLVVLLSEILVEELEKFKAAP